MDRQSHASGQDIKLRSARRGRQDDGRSQSIRHRRAYAEAKDHIGGYTVITASDLDEATDIARGCPFLAVGGTVEIRSVLAVK